MPDPAHRHLLRSPSEIAAAKDRLHRSHRVLRKVRDDAGGEVWQCLLTGDRMTLPKAMVEKHGEEVVWEVLSPTPETEVE